MKGRKAMKRNHTYEIDPLKQTVTVTRKFLENASQLGKEYDLLQRFEKMGLKISVYQRAKNKTKDDTKPAMLTYKMMEDYISMLDDAEEMLQIFETMKASVKKNPKRMQRVNEWFRDEFPNYDNIPEFDDDFHIVHNPNPQANNIALAS